MSKELQDKLKLVRAQLGLSQSQFAEVLGTSLKTLHNWEQDRTTPRGLALQLLNTKLDELLTK